MAFNIPPHLTGLNSDEVVAAQKKYGYNRINAGHKNSWVSLLLDILKEPMLQLLIAVGIIDLSYGSKYSTFKYYSFDSKCFCIMV